MTKIKPPTKQQFEDAKIAMAISWCPNVYACKKCHWPVFRGYCCAYCGDVDPHTPKVPK